MDKRITLVLLNGPKSSGKDYMTQYMLKQHVQLNLIHPAAPSRDHIENLLGMKLTEEQYNLRKDLPDPKLGGHSIREEMINYSENYMKPRFGKEVFSKIMYAKMQACMNNVPFICTSIGFLEEVKFFYDLLLEGQIDNLILFRVYRLGTTFYGDSRYYVIPEDMPLLTVVDLHNDGPVSESVKSITHWLTRKS